MALITCPECGGQVSDQAPACIHCGYPLSNRTATQTVVTPTVQYVPAANSVAVTNPLEGAYVSSNVLLNTALKRSVGWEMPSVGTYNVMVTGYSGCTKSKAITALRSVCGYSLVDATAIVTVLPMTILSGMSMRQGIAVAQSLDSLGVDTTVYGFEGVITYRSYRNNSSFIWNLALGALVSTIDSARRRPPRRPAYRTTLRRPVPHHEPMPPVKRAVRAAKPLGKVPAKAPAPKGPAPKPPVTVRKTTSKPGPKPPAGRPSPTRPKSPYDR